VHLRVRLSVLALADRIGQSEAAPAAPPARRGRDQHGNGLRGLELDGEPLYGTITGLYGLESLPVRFTPS
jgi:hypothetical protein